MDFFVTFVWTPPLRTRATHLMVTCGTHYHPEHPHPDFPVRYTGRASPIRTTLRKGKRHLYAYTSGRISQYIRMTNIGDSDMIVRVIDWSKASLARYHNSLSWPTFRHLQSEGTRWSDNKSLPTIISYDHQPRSLTVASPTTISVSRP